MSLADDLANGGTFNGWSFAQSDLRKHGIRRAGFRGSAAFFALLLAAATSAHSEESSEAGMLTSGANVQDGASLHGAPAPQPATPSKFSRRRLPV